MNGSAVIHSGFGSIFITYTLKRPEREKMDIRKQIFPLIMKTTMFYCFLIITVNKRFATENRNIPRPMLVNIRLSNFCLY